MDKRFLFTAAAAAALLAACNKQTPANETAAAANDVGAATSNAPAAATTAKTSFDCAKAKGQSQELVCTDANLAAMDVELDRLYRLADASPDLTGKNADEFHAMQRGWIKGRDDCWKADDLKACVTDAYAERIHRIRQGSKAARVDVPQSISIGPVAFACKGLDALIGATFINSDPGAVFLEWGPSERHTLAHVESGSGARYAATVDGGEMVFWNKGREATLSMPGKPDLTCTQEEIG